MVVFRLEKVDTVVGLNLGAVEGFFSCCNRITWEMHNVVLIVSCEQMADLNKDKKEGVRERGESNG